MGSILQIHEISSYVPYKWGSHNFELLLWATFGHKDQNDAVYQALKLCVLQWQPFISHTFAEKRQKGSLHLN